MPGFSAIDVYKNLVKTAEFGDACTDLMDMDQEVPQVRSLLEQGDIKTEIKLEDDQEVFWENIIANQENDRIAPKDVINFSYPSHLPTLPSYHYAPNTRGDMNSSTGYSPRTSPSHTSNVTPSSSSSSSFSSVSSSPLLSSVAAPLATSQSPLLSTSDSTSLPSEQKTRTFVSHGSGCTLVTSSTDYSSSSASSPITPFINDFLNVEYSTSPHQNNFLSPPSECVPEDKLDFLDMDNQQMSFYDDTKPSTDMLKLNDLPSAAEENRMLEEIVNWARFDLQRDMDNINLPHDPMAWTVDNVQTWANLICQKKNFAQVHCGQINGRGLCSLQLNDFLARFGAVGSSLYDELGLLRINANINMVSNCLPDTFSTQHTTFLQQHQQQQQQHHHQQQQQPQMFSYMERTAPGVTTHKTAMGMGPCVSPAPSNSSSNSLESPYNTSRGYSDYSDEDTNLMYSSASDLPSRVTTTHQAPPKSHITKTGRGHKTTIHLWQFLKELLLSKDNHNDCIRWIDHSAGIFKIEDSKKVASLWGKRKNRPAMNYDKLSRSVRQYYKKGIIKKTTQSKRLVYQFCPDYLS